MWLKYSNNNTVMGPDSGGDGRSASNDAGYTDEDLDGWTT